MMVKGIIFVYSTLLSSLCAYAVNLVDSVTGIVGGGNYSYYSLSESGTILMLLESFQGDADLYVSYITHKPTYDIENHDFQSVTCGLDHIKLSSDDKRPLAIAVYGHPSHETSVYRLQIIVDRAGEQSEFEYPGSTVSQYSSNNHPEASFSSDAEPAQHTRTANNKEEESIIWTILVSVLQVLLDILVD